MHNIPQFTNYLSLNQKRMSFQNIFLHTRGDLVNQVQVSRLHPAKNGISLRRDDAIPGQLCLNILRASGRRSLLPAHSRSCPEHITITINEL